MLDAADFTTILRSALRGIHLRNSTAAIEFPLAQGVFPGAFFVQPLLVVPDANILRNDILHACSCNQRTVLVTAANSGLLRLFCAQHVVDEVLEHAGEWTKGYGISRETFLDRWITEYLPVIRVVSSRDITPALLSPDERERVERLGQVDPDDVPSATIALVLEAFYLSADRRALCAVYGREKDLSAHHEWLRTLKAGGDAGELARMLHLVVSLLVALGTPVASLVRQVVAALRWWSLVPLAGLSAVAMRYTSNEIKQDIASAAISTGKGLLNALAAYHEVLSRFEEAVPSVPDWDELASTNDKDAVLLRACLHTLARSPMSDRSAEELSRELPILGVAQGEAKVRCILRSHYCFAQVWKGRWQVGEVAPLLVTHLSEVAATGPS